MKIVVVIPIYKHLEELTSFELASLRNNINKLQKHDKIVISPNLLLKQNMDFFALNDINIQRVEYFPNECFQSIADYNHLLISINFYERFLEWDYIFICQTDVWVFRDELKDYAELGYDYLGGICFHEFDKPCFWELDNVFGAINGGASLRRVDSHKALLQGYTNKMPDVRAKKSIIDAKFLSDLYTRTIQKGMVNKIIYDCLKERHNEDYILFLLAKRTSYFHFGDIHQREIGLFAWDVAPWVLHVHYGSLPMAAHAWYRMDGVYRGNKVFWEKYIL